MYICPFAEHHRAALQLLYLQVRRASFPWLDQASLHQQDFDRDTSGESILVACDKQGTVLGFASLWTADNFLHHLYISPAAQRQGLGRALLQACEARYSGTPSLKCFAANLAALAFYRQQGWQQTDEGIGADGQPYLLLQGPVPNVIFSDDKARLQQDMVYQYLSGESYWARGLPREVFESSLTHSLCVGGYNTAGEQIAFARVITDYATFGYLADVFVQESARGQGIAKALMRYIQLHPQLQNLRRFMLATADAHSLYAQFGFGSLSKPERIMEKVEPEIYQRLAAERGASC